MSERVDRVLVEGLLSRGEASDPVRVLNLPSGDGELSRLLDERGAQATSADLFPELSCYRSAEVVPADMNDRLPFDDDSFDALVCQEGIEHLEDVAGFLGECRRVLVEGGELWLTTPNCMDLSSRLAWFLMGTKSFHGDFPNEESTLWGVKGDRHYHGHAFTLPFFQIRYLLRIQQFDDIRLSGLGESGTARALYLFLRPLAGPFLRRSLARRTDRDRRAGKPATSPGLSAELVSLALSRALLCSKKICVRAVLREGSFQPEEGGTDEAR